MKAPRMPAKSAVEEIEVLHHLFRTTLEAYAAEVEQTFTRVREGVQHEAKKRNSVHFGDCEKIVTKIRKLKIEPEKGCRRDLKKIEKVLEKIDQKTAGWGESFDRSTKKAESAGGPELSA